MERRALRLRQVFTQNSAHAAISLLERWLVARLRLAGRDHAGAARVVRGDDPPAVELLRAYMDRQPMAARAQGVMGPAVRRTRCARSRPAHSVT